MAEITFEIVKVNAIRVGCLLRHEQLSIPATEKGENWGFELTNEKP